MGPIRARARHGALHVPPPAPCYEGSVSKPSDVPDHFSTFSARIGKVGINFCVDVPPAVSRALGDGASGRVPVVGAVNGAVEIRTTLMPRGGGKHRLFLDGHARAAAGVGEGDRVDVALMLDEQPRDLEVPEDLQRALRDARALRSFEGFARGKRDEIIRWIEAAARSTTRDKRIARAVEEALAVQERAADRASDRRRRRRIDTPRQAP